MDIDKEIRLYKIILSVKTAVAVNLKGHELTEEDAKTLAINSVKKILNNCEIISVEELEVENS